MNSQLENLRPYGWNEFFQRHFDSYSQGEYEAGRVAAEHKDTYRLYTNHGELAGEVTGRLRHEARNRADLPAVGDWVVIQPRPNERKAAIHAVLPRRSEFTRKVAGQRIEEQVVGSNIDTIFLVTSLDHDLNLRRLERYLTLTWNSGATPVILLSKADLCENAEERLRDVQAIAAGVLIHLVSAITNKGLDLLRPHFGIGRTVALLGSSGVGKSTIINRLLESDRQRVQPVREKDNKGRHTTTHRELILLPLGGLVLDTPGMRELQMWDSEAGLHKTFDEVESLGRGCYFSDCGHAEEPGCAVRAALDDGRLDEARYRSYETLKREADYIARKQNIHAQIAEKRKWKKLSRLASERSKQKRQ